MQNIVKSWRLLLEPGATCNGRRFVPHIPGGASLSPRVRKGGCLMSTSEVFQLCLVIIGVVSLVLQANQKKK